MEEVDFRPFLDAASKTSRGEIDAFSGEDHVSPRFLPGAERLVSALL